MNIILKNNKVFQNKIIVLIALFIIITAGLLYASFPKTTVTMSVIHDFIDEKGQLKSYKEFQSILKKNNINLVLKVIPNELSGFEGAVKDSSIDFTIVTNNGYSFPENIKEEFRSIGVFRKVPIFILASPNTPEIKYLSELRGKTIAIKMAPDTNGVKAFADGYLGPSVYAGDYIYADLFRLLNINLKNTKFVNSYPDPAFSVPDADYYFGFYAPNQIGSTADLFKKIEQEKYQFLAPIDVEGVARRSKASFESRLEPSTLSPSRAIPSQAVPYLFSTVSMVVRKNLDPSLIMILSEALQSEASSSTTFRMRNEFPTFLEGESFSPHPIAVDYYKNGKPFLTNYMSPALAALIIKILIVLIPLLTILWPITNLVPKIYSFYVKHKITHWYVDLEMIDKSLDSADEETRKIYSEIIEKISRGITEMRLPFLHTHYAQELFAARAHVNLIRAKLNELKKTSVNKAEH
jgi:hypothetical protein